jgi:acetyl-CoA C-acetyltransferase
VTIDEVLASAMVADPMRLLHCSPISDGAAALVLEAVDKTARGDVELLGSGQGADTLSLAKRNSLTSLKATKQATSEALIMADAKIESVGVVELHDCFTIAEMMALEDLELLPSQKSGDYLANGFGRLDGSGVVVNTSGGLKACGHPVGATGVKQVVEVVRQLSGKAKSRQVKNVQLALTHNVGGSGATAVVHVFGRQE